MTQNVVLVPFPEVAEVVEPWLEKTASASKPSQGVPAHVTLLFPSPADADGIAAALADVAPFDVELRALRRFPDTLWLAPEPAETFVRLIERLAARFPDWPPYGGVHDTIVPHLTVARGDEGTLDAAERAVAPHLPLRGRAREALLLTELEPGRWVTDAAFPFEGP